MQALLASPGIPDARARCHFAAATGSAAVVLGGDTLPPGVEVGCRHGTAWFVRRLGLALIDMFEMVDDRTPTQRLAQATVNVNALHQTTCNLMASTNPTSSLAIAHEAGNDDIEFIVLGEAVVVVDRPDGVKVIQDTHMGSRSPQAVESRGELLQWRSGDVESGAAPSCASPHSADLHRISTNPNVAEHAVTGTLQRRDVQRLALLSASPARYPFGGDTSAWRHILDLLTEKSPARPLDDARKAQRTRTGTPNLLPSHMDAEGTVILCRFDPAV